MCARSEFLLMEHEVILGEFVLVVLVKVLDLAINDLSVIRKASVPA